MISHVWPANEVACVNDPIDAFGENQCHASQFCPNESRKMAECDGQGTDLLLKNDKFSYGKRNIEGDANCATGDILTCQTG